MICSSFNNKLNSFRSLSLKQDFSRNFASQVNVFWFINLLTFALENNKNAEEKHHFSVIRMYSTSYYHILVVENRDIPAIFFMFKKWMEIGW